MSENDPLSRTGKYVFVEDTPEEGTEDRRNERRRMSDSLEVRPWHFDRTISIGHIITTLTVVISMLVWASRTETRISILESHNIEQDSTISEFKLTLKEGQKEIKDALTRIEDKLDKKADKKGGY